MTDRATDYAPIACGFHDRLEHHAVVGDRVEIVWREGDAERSAQTQIADVFAKDGADWVRLGTRETVRADRLLRVAGVPLPGAC